MAHLQRVDSNHPALERARPPPHLPESSSLSDEFMRPKQLNEQADGGHYDSFESEYSTVPDLTKNDEINRPMSAEVGHGCIMG